MKLLKLTTLTSMLFLLAACVTINIYFPSAQAEEAAERIVEDILGKQAPKKEDKGAWLETPKFEMIAVGLLNLLIPQAQAAQPDFNVDTPQIRKLQANMKQRNLDLEAYYSSGAVGFTHDARIAIHNQSAISLKERARAERLISDENRDRDALYSAIAAANGHPEWTPEVRATFARTWIDKAKKGWWYEVAPGNWKQR